MIYSAAGGEVRLIIAIAIMPGASAFPTYNYACNGCHAYPPKQINIATDVSSVTVSPGQAFRVNITYSGGGTGSQTAVSWPTDFSSVTDKRDNALFGITPNLPVVVGRNTNGSISSILTAPATAGSYIVRVHAATGSTSGLPKETDYRDINVKVQAPAPAMTLTAPADINTMSTGTLTTVSPGTATANGGTPPYTITNDAPSAGFPVGTTTVTWTATDSSGATATATQSVTIKPAPSTETANVTIVVTDNATGKPIYGAKVSLNEKALRTDRKGSVRFTNVSPGTYSLEVEKKGYKEIESSITVTGDMTLPLKLVKTSLQRHHITEQILRMPDK